MHSFDTLYSRMHIIFYRIVITVSLFFSLCFSHHTFQCFLLRLLVSSYHDLIKYLQNVLSIFSRFSRPAGFHANRCRVKDNENYRFQGEMVILIDINTALLIYTSGLEAENFVSIRSGKRVSILLKKIYPDNRT